MTRDQILNLFRDQADKIQGESPLLNVVILDLAQMLADSRGRLSKENFDTLLRIGGALYKEGQSQFHGKSDVDAIMKKSTANKLRE
jgi:hypothetical protein